MRQNEQLDEKGKKGNEKEVEEDGESTGVSGGPYYSSFSSGVLCPFGGPRDPLGSGQARGSTAEITSFRSHRARGTGHRL